MINYYQMKYIKDNKDAKDYKSWKKRYNKLMKIKYSNNNCFQSSNELILALLEADENIIIYEMLMNRYELLINKGQ